ncbi:DUF397 domain-containing protein [Streptomyces yunnanensis]|uniref:DUF397 domain-containing protein n=1 Tax=Streptomyces yunnanensis TaxID=156453 RepID=A0A9X8N592_9ACTN|nr:DUF397 domain-containing protein [Streptomyces yunnanensis]SHN04006.1 protein of unknown function [Streptomyces yunnanensis]
MSSTPELAWFKSSYSSGGDGDCVEVALSWRKSSYSGDDSGDCIEIAACPTTVHVRDSKDKDGPRLAVPGGAWAAFVTYAAQGR